MEEVAVVLNNAPNSSNAPVTWLESLPLPRPRAMHFAIAAKFTRSDLD